MMGRRRSRYLRVLLLPLLLNSLLMVMSLLLNFLLLDDEVERCAAPQHLGLIDRFVREHGPPGAPRRSQMSDVDCPTQLTCTKEQGRENFQTSEGAVTSGSCLCASPPEACTLCDGREPGKKMTKG